MNRIYKVIWSKARNCYVVVSEIAKHNGKCSSSLNKKIIASFLAAGLVTTLPMSVEAHSIINGESGIITRTGPGSGVMWGKGTASGPRTTAFGENTNASTNNATAFGNSTTARQHNATSFGVGTYADSRQATAFGAYTYAGTVFTYNGEVVTPVRRVIDRYLDSSDPDTTTPKEAWVLVKEDGTFVNTGQRFDGDYDAKGDITYSLNYQRMMERLDKSTASGDNQRSATAFGEYSIATGQDATAFGYRSAATAWSATAWGHETAALGKRSTAFGVETWASGNNATAFGYRTEATNENSTAWGSNTEATGLGATAWGSHTISGGDNSTTWGKNSEVGSGSLTYDGEAYTNLSIQLTTYDGYDEYGSYTQIGHYYVQGRDKDGKLVTIKEFDDDGNPLWKWNYNGETDQDTRETIKQWIKSKGGTLAGDYSTAFGDSSKVYAENALGALGGIVGSAGTNSAAIGKGATVSVRDTVALGSNSVADRDNVTNGTAYTGYNVGTDIRGTANTNYAIGGKNAWVATDNAIAVGNGSTVTRQITGVAAGYEDTDAVNVAQLKVSAALKTDNRNVGLIVNKENKREIVSPYIHVDGVEAATQATQTIATYDRLTTEKTRLESEKTALETEKTTLETVLTTLNVEKTALDTDLAALDPSSSEYWTKYREIKTALEVNQTQINEIQAEIDAKQAEVNAKQSEITATGNAITALQNDYNTARTTVKDFAQATGENAIAIGKKASASGDNSVALGSNSVADRGPATEAGYDVITGSAYTGTEKDEPMWKSTLAAVSVGGGEVLVDDGSGNMVTKTATRQITGVAAGSDDTDAVNVAQLKVASALETDNRNVGLIINADGKREIFSPYIHVEGVEEATTQLSTAIERLHVLNSELFVLQEELNELYNDPVANATAIAGKQSEIDNKQNEINAQQTVIENIKTPFALATSENAVAIGKNAKAYGANTIAMGDGATAGTTDGAPTPTYGGNNAVAIGRNATASGDNSVAVGADNNVYAENSLAFGNNNVISSTATNSIAMGNSVVINNGATSAVAIGDTATIDENASYATAIGYNARAEKSDSVALGSGSLAKRDAGIPGYDFLTGERSTNTSSAWRANSAAVSVGNDEITTRQITGVAAGTLDTDAVNVAQLKATHWNIGTSVENDSTIVDPEDDNRRKGTIIGDALNVDNTIVGNGKNKIRIIAGEGMTLTPTTYADGYGITFQPDFRNVKTDATNLVLEEINFNGHWLKINSAPGITVPNILTDHRAVTLLKTEVIDGKEYQVIESPLFHVNGLPQSVQDNAIPEAEKANASGDHAIAIGRSSTSVGTYAVAIGYDANALEESSLAVGRMAESTNPNATAVGFKANALANNAVSVGTDTFVTGNRGIAIGTSSTLKNVDSAPDYQRTWAAGQGSIVFGNEARAVTEDERYSGKTNVDYETNDAIAIGTRADARATNAIALGGNMSFSDATGHVTYGKQKGNDRDFGATVGEGAKSAIAIGGAYGELTTKTEDNKEVTVPQVTYEAAATYGARSIAIGTGAAVANTEDFLDLKAMLDESGTSESYQDLRAAYYTARQAYTDAEKDLNNFYLRGGTDSTEEQRLIGIFNDAKLALFGEDGETEGAYGAFQKKIQEKIKLELENAESVKDAIAIGTNSQAKTAGAIALGSNSVAGFKDRAGTESKLTGYDERTGAGYIGRSSTLPAWRSTAASVSVGGGTTTYTDYLGNPQTVPVTRRISNVAAGVYDTDAVNVAQLKRAATINSDERNTAISTNDEGEMLLNSPYIHVEGVKEVSDALAITSYESAKKYEEALKEKKTSLEPKLGYTDAQGRYIKGSFDQQMAKLEADIAALNDKARNTPNDTIKNGYLALAAEAEDEWADLKARKESALAALEEVNELLKDPEGAYKKAEETVAKQSKAYGTESVAIGKESVVGEADSTKKGNQSVAIGVDNTVTGNNSIAVGTGHEIAGNRSGAFGDPTKIDADDSYAIGNSNTITGDGAYSFILGNDNTVKTADTYVIGSHVNTTYKNSVFLGNASGYVEKGDSTSGIAKYDHYDGFGESYKFAGAEAAGVVSIGGYVDGKLANRRIQNVAAGLISETSTDAINGSQLYQAIQALSINVVADDDKSAKVVRDPETGVGSGGGTGTAATTYTISSGKTTIEKTEDNLSKSGNLLIEDTLENEETDPKSYHYNIDLNKNIDLGEDGSLTVGESKIDTNGYQIGDTNIDKEGLSIKDGPSVKKDGINAGNKKIENVADGEGANDAVNVSQLQNSGISFNGDSGDSGLIKLGDQYNASFNVKGDNNITTEASAGQLNIKLKEQIDLGENGSVTIGNTTVKNNSVAIEGGPSMTIAGFKHGSTTVNDTGLKIENGPSVTTTGIDAGGKKITNVAPGEANTDAVNVGQLRDYAAGNNQAMSNLGNQISNVESRAKKGIAGAAALAALHPLDFDPDDKLTFAAGMGHYRGETAAAVGAFYRPDEKVMFSIGGTMGNGENMVNAGVSFSLDRTPRVTGSRTALTKEVVQLREQVARQDARLARQDAQIEKLTALVMKLTGNEGMEALSDTVGTAVPMKAPALFPDNLDNKWAYDFLEDLEQRGYIHGYAGRSLTRDEFAAALDRAMAGGAKLDERLIKEFEPELSHVRVVHIEGKGNEEGQSYERPRTSHDKLENKHEIEKKHFRVKEKKVTSKS